VSPAAKSPVLFFDIGNVLVRFDESEVARSVAFRWKVNPLRAARFFINSPIVDAVERGKMSPQELYRTFKDQLGFKGSFAHFRKLWCGYFKVDRKSQALFLALSKRYRLYLISNTNELHFEHLTKNYAFLGKAQGAILSHRLGLRKPEPAIYRKALEAAGVAAAEAVFIDDRLENVLAAGKIGIKSIHFKGAEKLRDELAALGIF
jgi:FMN phosphatase YigB (HAD superfamily)